VAFRGGYLELLTRSSLRSANRATHYVMVQKIETIYADQTARERSSNGERFILTRQKYMEYLPSIKERVDLPTLNLFTKEV
jgi:hypothetical protein